jgi:hypothetical protein
VLASFATAAEWACCAPTRRQCESKKEILPCLSKKKIFQKKKCILFSFVYLTSGSPDCRRSSPSFCGGKVRKKAHAVPEVPEGPELPYCKASLGSFFVLLIKEKKKQQIM